MTLAISAAETQIKELLGKDEPDAVVDAELKAILDAIPTTRERRSVLHKVSRQLQKEGNYIRN